MVWRFPGCGHSDGAISQPAMYSYRRRVGRVRFMQPSRRLVFRRTRRHVADDHAFQPFPQRCNVVYAVQLLKLPLRFLPERGRSFVQALPRLGQFDKATSAVRGRGLDRDEAVAFEEANHFSHRRSFDIESFRKGIDRCTPHFMQGGQGEELRDAQTHGLEMAVVESGDLPARLPHGEAVTLIDSEWLVNGQHVLHS
ncbi:hypothetical protein BLAT2472_80290 [Burkholderia latens]